MDDDDSRDESTGFDGSLLIDSISGSECKILPNVGSLIGLLLATFATGLIAGGAVLVVIMGVGGGGAVAV